MEDKSEKIQEEMCKNKKDSCPNCGKDKCECED